MRTLGESGFVLRLLDSVWLEDQPNAALRGSLVFLARSSLYLHHRLDLHRDAVRQGTGAHCRAGMHALLAENLKEEVRAAVDHK